MSGLLLTQISLLPSPGTLRSEVLIPNVEDFRDRWDRAVDALATAVETLRHPQMYGSISSKYLPYVSILPAFAALQIARSSNRQLGCERKIRHWYWASVFTNRYSGSVESTSARDYLDVKAWFDNDAAEPALIAEFKARFRGLELRRETRRGTSVYNGVFNLLVLRGAQDWMTGHAPKYDDLDDHHIVPKSWGSDRKLETSIDSILNRTPLTADTNRNVIRERLPNAYLPELIKNNGEGTVCATLESHFISPKAFDILLRDPFTETDFEEFLVERQRTLQEAIEGLLVKERLDLPPQLRELDAQVEAVELSLRQIVNEELNGQNADIPSHVAQKITDRLQTASRRNPALDADHYESLEGRLEYADLRDLQDTVTNKGLWSRFEPRLGNKEALVHRFGQLAELRNGIRHSRTVDEMTRKDWEAALFFSKGIDLPPPLCPHPKLGCGRDGRFDDRRCGWPPRCLSLGSLGTLRRLRRLRALESSFRFYVENS